MADTAIVRSPSAETDADRIAGQIEQQSAVLAELEKEYARLPSTALELRIKRKTDTLLHLHNQNKRSPGDRAQAAAAKARQAVLGTIFA